MAIDTGWLMGDPCPEREAVSAWFMAHFYKACRFQNPLRQFDGVRFGNLTPALHKACRFQNPLRQFDGVRFGNLTPALQLLAD